jgi:flavin-dependent dehydrogenase
MMIEKEFDVAVIGAGPGGSTAAKKCAEAGLKTVLLEKRTLPRNKTCTGMIMSDMSQRLIREEFGSPPEEVLTTPPYLQGIRFHAPAVEPLTFERRMPFAWRKDFDYWMNKIVKGMGVELWDKTRVKGIAEEERCYMLSMEREEGPDFVKARFLIGADGAHSVVRKSWFPDVEMRYQLCVRLCYQGTLDLDPAYVHYFYHSDLIAFEVNCKGDVFLLEMTPRSAQEVKSVIIKQAEKWLIQDFGFTPNIKPLWRDGCVEPSMVRRPFSGPFPLAKDNVLLVGNAAGLIKPVTGEGIGTAIKSGLMAAESVIQASKKGEKADKFYLPMAQDMVNRLNSMYPPHGKIREAAQKGMDCFLTTVKDIYSDITGIL